MNARSTLDVVIVEDNVPLMRRVRKSLSSKRGLRIVGTAGSVRDALELLNATKPQILLVDIGLPDGSGITVIQTASRLHPECEIIVVTVLEDPAIVIASIEAGATGYLLKDSEVDGYVQAIEQVSTGGSPISPAIARQLLVRCRPLPNAPAMVIANESCPGVEFSKREAEVLGLLARGFNYEEIGKLLEVSGHTVDTYVRRIYRKLQVHSRSEAVYEAQKLGILPP